MLIHVDFVDGCRNSWSVEAEGDETEDDAGLVAKHRPAEMNVRIKHDETADAHANEDKSGGHRRPHPRLDRAQMRVLVWIEVLQTLDRLTHLDVTHARTQHQNDDNRQRGYRLDHAVSKMQRLRGLMVAQIECLLDISYNLWLSVSF